MQRNKKENLLNRKIDFFLLKNAFFNESENRRKNLWAKYIAVCVRIYLILHLQKACIKGGNCNKKDKEIFSFGPVKIDNGEWPTLHSTAWNGQRPISQQCSAMQAEFHCMQHSRSELIWLHFCVFIAHSKSLSYCTTQPNQQQSSWVKN